MIATHGDTFKTECTRDECLSILFRAHLKCKTYCLEQYRRTIAMGYMIQANLADFILESIQDSGTLDQSS